MGLDYKMVVKIECDGGGCNCADVVEIDSHVVQDAADIFRSRRWRSSSGCWYCPACSDRIFS